MKKTIAILAILMSVVLIVFGVQHHLGGLSESHIVTITLEILDDTVAVPQRVINILDKSDFVAFNKAVNRASSSEKMIENAYIYSAELVDNNKISYALDVDFDNRQLLVAYDDQVKRLSFDDAVVSTMLTNPEFSVLYTGNFIPHAMLNSGNKKIRLNVGEYTWQYQNIKNETISQHARNLSYDNVVTLADNHHYITLDFLKAPDEVIVKAHIGDTWQIVKQDDPTAFRPVVIRGKTEYQIWTKHNTHGENNAGGQVVYTFAIDLTPYPVANVTQSEMQAGGFFNIIAENIEADHTLVIEQSIIEEPLEQFRIGETIYATIPLNYWAEQGMYPIRVYTVKNEQKNMLYEGQLIVNDTNFDVQNLTIDPTVEKEKRSNEAYEEYNAAFMPVRQKSIAKQLWEGPFIMPVEGRITTNYGVKRRVNGSMTSYRHNGIDIAADKGAPIKASNSGKIVFSKMLILTGNTVMIDHGLGLFTVYLHLDEIHFVVGDDIKKGEIIGTVGSTGFSTGPHLHFTTSYHLVNLNPFFIMAWDGNWPNHNKH